MEILTLVLYHVWGDRGVAKLLLLFGLLVLCYRKYKSWKISRRYKSIEGKVILLTGASSGLGEGTIITIDNGTTILSMVNL